MHLLENGEWARRMRIRTAGADDAQAIARVRALSWQAAYRGIIPSEHLATLSVDTVVAHWRAILSYEPYRRFILVAEQSRSAIVGYVFAGPERVSNSACGGELFELYVLPSRQRQGVGRELVCAASARLVGSGVRSMTIWALAANTSGRRFYEAIGGVIKGRRALRLGGLVLPEVAYGWKSLNFTGASQAV